MAFPPGVQTATLTFSNPIAHTGTEATRTEVTIVPSASIVWSATGQPFDDFADVVNPGPALGGSLSVPFVDQDGFTNHAGAEITMWSYVVTRRTFFGKIPKTVTKTWQPVLGQPSIDFDNLPGLVVGSAITVSPVPVTSVNGQGGIVSLTKADVGLSNVNDTADSQKPVSIAQGIAIGQKIDTSQKGAALGVATLDAGSKILESNLPTRLGDAALSATIVDQTSTKLEKFSSGAPSATNQEVFSDVAVRGALKGKFTGGGDHIGNYRQPFGQTFTYDAANLPEGGGDKVANVNNIIFVGDFTPDWSRPGGAPKWLWGANDFIMLGPLVGPSPVLGITDAWARLTEVHVNAPTSTFGNVFGLIGESNIGATATGSSISGWFASVKAAGPRNNSGATVANAASLYVTSPAAATATNQYAVYVGGTEKSRFGGDVLLNENSGTPKNFNAYYGGFIGQKATLGNPGTASAALLTVKADSDATVVAWFQGRGTQQGDLLRMGRDATIGTRFDMRGRVIQANTVAPLDADMANGELATYVETTAGHPKLSIKAKDSAGTVFNRSISLAPASGITANRPAPAVAGAGGQYYDTTLSKPVWSDGTSWRDAMGTSV